MNMRKIVYLGIIVFAAYFAGATWFICLDILFSDKYVMTVPGVLFLGFGIGIIPPMTYRMIKAFLNEMKDDDDHGPKRPIRIDKD